MASKLELIYDVKEYMKAYSDDVELSNEHIMFLYRKKRAKHLRQLLNDYTRKFDNITLQSFCVSLEEVDKSLCGLEVGCTILRSTIPIPTLLDLRSRDTLISVGPSLIGAEKFKIINIEQASYILQKPYSTGIYTFIDTDGYLYIIANDEAHKMLECIYVTGLFEDPEELESFSTGCNSESNNTNPCFTENTEYPLQGFLIDTIGNEIKKELVSRLGIPEDKDNNSDDDQTK